MNNSLLQSKMTSCKVHFYWWFVIQEKTIRLKFAEELDQKLDEY